MPSNPLLAHRAVAPRFIAALLAAGCVAFPTQGMARARSDAPAAAPVSRDPLVIVVSLRKQRLTVFDKSGTVTQSPVSSGQADFPTPTGVFSIIGKEVEHESNIYEGASMPYMQRLTWSGTAMHAGNLPGYAASHGCIRLPYSFSKRLFDLTAVNTRVIVTHDDVSPQPISHPKLFAPAAPEGGSAKAQPMVSAVGSKVASLAGIAPAMATEAAGPLPLSAKANARLAQTAHLFEAIKVAEGSRNIVWDKVKTANRDLENAKADVDRSNDAIEAARHLADKSRRAKKSAESQLAGIMRKAEDAAETRLIDESNKLDAVLDHVAELKMGISALESKIEVAETARRALDDDLKSSNQGLKDAQTAYSIAKREDARLAKPVSVFVSRRTQRLYVRQGFDPVLEVPVTITNPEQPLGTHVFTAMGIKDGDLSWSVVSLQSPTHGEETRRAKAGVDGRGATAAKSLDRITVPQEALDAIAEVVKPGSSFVISDEATSEYFGSGTDFTVAVR